jgi:biopolymer transport protein ExbD
VKFKRSNKLQSVPNLTPLIDVVFLLLIFFMVSTSFSRETRLLVSLPEADGEVVSSAEAIEVLVTREGNYAINGRQLISSDARSLMRGLELESGGDSSRSLVLVADAQAVHQSVVTAMEAIGQAGFANMSIATQRLADEQ